MKQKVYFFISKEAVERLEKIAPKSHFAKETTNSIIDYFFPKDKYDFEFIDYPLNNSEANYDKILEEDVAPILIGYKEGSDYIEPIKNYKHKYLISPSLNSENNGLYKDITEYDLENTTIVLGESNMDNKTVLKYSAHYPMVLNLIDIEKRSFVETMWSIGIWEKASNNSGNGD